MQTTSYEVPLHVPHSTSCHLFPFRTQHCSQRHSLIYRTPRSFTPCGCGSVHQRVRLTDWELGCANQILQIQNTTRCVLHIWLPKIPIHIHREDGICNICRNAETPTTFAAIYP